MLEGGVVVNLLRKMDFDEWMGSVKNTTDNKTLVSLFSLFTKSVQEQKSIDYSDIMKIIKVFKHAFKNVTEDNIISVLEALDTLIQYSEHDIEHYIKSLLPSLLLTYFDYKLTIKKASRKCLQTYLIKTRNTDDIIEQYIESGLLSKNVEIRVN